MPGDKDTEQMNDIHTPTLSLPSLTG